MDQLLRGFRRGEYSISCIISLEESDMKYGSVFSGIGGFDLGLDKAGMTCAWQVEIDPACQKVLSKHCPDVPKHGDIRDVGKHNLKAVDVICGGFPCQDLSIAGKRQGLAGERSGLWFELARIIEELRPGWVVIENVPGLLSSNRGNDFAVILRGLVECGYGVAWRVLDAQYFGVAQCRRRVFIVGSLGNGRAAEVLFESEGMSRDTPPSREAGKEIANPLGAGAHGDRRDLDNNTYNIVRPLRAQANASHREDSDTYIAFNADRDGLNSLDDISPTLTHKGDGEQAHGSYQKVAIAWHENKQGNLTPSDIAKALRSGASHSYRGVGVRRLTPTECERLQGFPDGWTDGQADSTRYRQLGNAVCVPVIEWIGKRIAVRSRL